MDQGCRTTDGPPVTADPGSVGGKGTTATHDPRLKKVDEAYFGYGDHADVYKGRLDGRLVAIKQLRGVNSNKTEIRDHLRSGLVNQFNSSWRKFNHPNVCRVHMISMDFGFLPALVLDYFSRGSLIKYIEKDEPHFDQRIKWVFEIASGLAYLHSFGVHHGDLRGANVFLGDGDRAVIADYSISHYFNNSDFTSAKSTGTVRWTGPEVISLPPNPNPKQDKLDIFALGMTMLEILSGKPPFWDKPDTAAIFAIAKNEPPTLPESMYRNDDLKNLFEACTQKNPDQRPPAREVADALKPLVPSPWSIRSLLRYMGSWIPSR